MFCNMVYKGDNERWALYFHHDVQPNGWRLFGKSTQS